MGAPAALICKPGGSALGLSSCLSLQGLFFSPISLGLSTACSQLQPIFDKCHQEGLPAIMGPELYEAHRGPQASPGAPKGLQGLLGAPIGSEETQGTLGSPHEAPRALRSLRRVPRAPSEPQGPPSSFEGPPGALRGFEGPSWGFEGPPRAPKEAY
ncbi:hypothetical protein, conserved [Eimeria tenella]|uniref:Uncharacterized protein n=1 Tax=Eimeria tenella TaxID=5802 RepID=U6KTZ8_EIMTE|nr:hypothetical protein, conserved [Eimeria tenella]CDJ39874.1 hypothetical protein, conserved [Eimeria tenella]|eukprot:XP_013230627.1 hypothetical protein, conserved [Eimeria tenella]